MKKALCPAASLGIIAILSGCLASMANVPPGTTFENRQPRWSWTGTWRGSGGSVFNIVQEGDQWFASDGVSGVARLYGNRAVGRATDGVPRTFDFVLSDDGMYAEGTVTILGMTTQASLTRISGPPDALANAVSRIDSAPGNAATQSEAHLSPGSGRGYLGIEIRDFTQPASVPNATSSQEGALVNKIVPGSPADQAGIRVGDIVTSVNDLPTRNANALANLIRQLRRGDRVTLDIHRKESVGEAKGLRLTAVVSELADTTSQARRHQPYEGGSGNVLTVDEISTMAHDNPIVAETRLRAMGVISVRGTLSRASDNVGKDGFFLVNSEAQFFVLRCRFPRGPNYSYLTPPEVMDLHAGDLVTAEGSFDAMSRGRHLDLRNCRIVSIVPAAQARPSEPDAVVGGGPSSLSPPPPGHYMGYINMWLGGLFVSPSRSGENLYLDGQGRYSTKPGARMEGRYEFDPVTSVVRFSGGGYDGETAKFTRHAKGDRLTLESNVKAILPGTGKRFFVLQAAGLHR